MNSAVLTLNHFISSILYALNRHKAQGRSVTGRKSVDSPGREGAGDRKLYAELDGPNLVAFSSVPLAISQPLNWEDFTEISVEQKRQCLTKVPNNCENGNVSKSIIIHFCNNGNSRNGNS